MQDNTKYPEFNDLIDEIAAKTLKRIAENAGKITSEMPYKKQYVLEKVIEKLEKYV